MSSLLHMQNPQPFLHDLHGKVIGVQLKWGWQLRGILQSKDQYMNLLLANAQEVVNGQKKGQLGEILIRWRSQNDRLRQFYQQFFNFPSNLANSICKIQSHSINQLGYQGTHSRYGITHHISK